MKFQTIFVFILLISCQNSNKTTLTSSYNLFLQNEKYLKDGKSSYNKNEYAKAIENYNKIQCLGIGCRSKNVNLAKIYMKTAQKNEAKKYIFKSISQGFDIYYLDKDLFSPLEKEINSNIDSLIGLYHNIIDIDIRKKILSMIKADQKVRDNFEPDSIIENIDSQNKIILDSIVSVIGWPSRNKIGHSTIEEWSDASVLILHNDLTSNLEYLDITINECIKGEENWYVPKGIFGNIIFRHSEKNDPVLLPYIKYSEKNIVDIGASIFIFKTIAEMLNRNRKFMIVFTLKSNNFSENCDTLLDFLFNENVEKNQISFKEYKLGENIENNTIHAHVEEI